MKKTKTIEIEACDFCDGDEHCYHRCLGCGKAVCHNCEKTQGVEYPHSLNFRGSGDGWYCSQCEVTDTSGLLASYRLMRSIRGAAERFYEETKKRADACEARIKELRPA